MLERCGMNGIYLCYCVTSEFSMFCLLWKLLYHTKTSCDNYTSKKFNHSYYFIVKQIGLNKHRTRLFLLCSKDSNRDCPIQRFSVELENGADIKRDLIC